MRKRELSAEQIKQAMALRRDGYGADRIGKVIGVSRLEVTRLLDPKAYERRMTYQAAYFKKWRSVNKSVPSPVKTKIVPPDVLHEREMALAVDPTPNMLILNDPPPTRSALYKKMMERT